MRKINENEVVKYDRLIGYHCKDGWRVFKTNPDNVKDSIAEIWNMATGLAR